MKRWGEPPSYSPWGKITVASPFSMGKRILIFWIDYPSHRGSMYNQLAPFRIGVNELIESIIFSFMGK